MGEDQVLVSLKKTQGGFAEATVDDITLTADAEGQLMTQEQADRLKATGAKLQVGAPDDRDPVTKLTDDHNHEQLQQEAAARNLPTSGTKKELAETIAQHDADQEG